MTSCPACGAEDPAPTLVTRHITPEGTFSFLCCRRCALWFSHPMREPGGAWYSASPIYKRRSAAATEDASPPFRPDWRHRVFAELPHRPGATLLDVGCGDGGFLEWAASRGYDVRGVDIDSIAVAVARRRVGAERVRVATLDMLATGRAESQGTYDFVCLFDVLEHVADPVGALFTLARLIAPGGRLVCTVPSHQRWPRWFAGDVDQPPHHLTLWSVTAIVKAASRAGLEASVLRSPLLSEHIVDQLAARFPRLRVGTLPSRLILAAVSFLLAPCVSAMLRTLRKDPGGFTLFVTAHPR